MALNLKKVDRKKNKADEMLELEFENEKTISHDASVPGTSTASMIESLNTAELTPPTQTSDTMAAQTSSELDAKGNSDKGLGLNKDGTYRQSRAGRKKKKTNEKKSQIALTISSTTLSKLNDWAESKPRSATNYLSMYIEDHLEEILERIDNT